MGTFKNYINRKGRVDGESNAMESKRLYPHLLNVHYVNENVITRDVIRI